MNFKKIIESLSPNERKILPYLGEEKTVDICKKSGLDKVSVLRALEYLQKKKIVNLSYKKRKLIEIDINGALYRRKGFPERRLLNLLDEKRIISIENAKKESKLSDNEFKISLGVLKNKAVIELKKGKIILNANKEEIAKKTLEESFIELLPLEYTSLKPEQIYAFKALQKRKNIIRLNEVKIVQIQITDLGRKIINLKERKKEYLEKVTSEMIKNEKKWRGKIFRRYDLDSAVPKIYGGKRHFVNQSRDYARKIWVEMGFKEMTGNLIQSSFWNFDALFTAQDHPVREMQDTFFIDRKAELPDRNLVEQVKKAHEKGIGGSIGWSGKWSEEEAKKLVLRTHTTSLSAITLSKIKKENLPVKFFSIGECFRNEAVDWSHGFEFNQTDCIVVDKNANFRHLLGYLKQFYKKMGFEKIRFSPAYFPYTEPSVEINVWHPEKKVWLELGGAGIFRPEVVIPLFGENISVLAWGPGFDRTLMDYYKIKDLREFYDNDLTKLRNIKFWIK
jgi:phenylalanyl-tRNA synthetase alpha chain